MEQMAAINNICRDNKKNQQTILEAIINKFHSIILPSPNWKVQVDRAYKNIIFSVAEDTYNYTNNRRVILSEANNHLLKTDMFMNNVKVEIPYVPKIASSINELAILLKAFSIVRFCSCYLTNHRETQCLIFSLPFVDICNDCLKNTDCKKIRSEKEKQEKFVTGQVIKTRQIENTDSKCSVRENTDFKKKNIKMSTCTFCKEQFESDNFIKHYEHHLPVNNAGQFICTICNKVFEYVSAIVSHYKSVHESVKFIECNICKHKYASLLSFERHYRNHAKIESFLCGYCNINFTNKYTFKKHLSKHSILNLSKVCDFCNKKYATYNLLTQHQREHSINKFTCRYCNENFDKKECLDNHKMKCSKRSHLKYTCKLCAKKFSRLSHKLCHIQRKHQKY